MRNLINFIVKNIHWLIFFFLIFLSFILIVNNNRFQRSKYLAVIQEVTGKLYSVSGEIESYVNLKNTNADLLNRLAELETLVYAYERQLELLTDTSGVKRIEIDSARTLVFSYTSARVVYNSVSNLENYITLDKGTKDGIESDMGVVSPRGVVGKIIAVSPHYSLVISILNPKFRLSCMVKSSNYFGPLVWDGKDPRYTYLEELPRHVDFDINDTIVTSGHSLIFPEGFPIGTIVDSQKQKNDNYNSLKIQLFTNFNTLENVLIVRNSYKEEQKNLQKTVNL